MCTDKYKDPIMKYSMFSVALESGAECPRNFELSKDAEQRYSNFPPGKFACTIVLESNCGAPSFLLDYVSLKLPENFKVFYLEYDQGLLKEQATKTFESSDPSFDG